jgi:DNA-binding winged helix-turn-helix (wHTH) protein
MSIRFGTCVFDAAARRLLRDGRDVRLSPKAIEFLIALIERRGEALAKADLLERVWPGVFVSDASLARVVSELRDAVGDDARRPRIVRTVHGYGYAFDAAIADVRPVPSLQSSLTSIQCALVSADKTFPLAAGEHIAGRDRDVSVWLDSPKVSRHHARVVVSALDVTIEDLDSKNGTLVRGTKISTVTRLEPGDEIRIGPFLLVFRVPRGQASTETDTLSV